MNIELEQLKAENEKLREDYIKLSQQKDLDNARWQKRCTDLHIEDKAKADKYWLVLQEIKAIAEELLEKGLEPQSVEHQLRLRGKRELASIILDFITKAESEEE